jgi:hypothetical protein
MRKRFFLLATAAFALATPLAAVAQDRSRAWRGWPTRTRTCSGWASWRSAWAW